MRKPFILSRTIVLFLQAVLLSNCSYNAYLQSPFDANLEKHHTIPLQSDTVRSAIYGGASICLGAADDELRDHIVSISWSVYRSHNFSFFQAYYGGGFTLGNYALDSPSKTGSTLRAAPGVNGRVLDSAAGNKFFGGYGISGGIDFVIPLGRVGEWRVLGLSANLENEFGKYLRFRKDLPASAANTIFRSSLTGTFGWSTELVIRTPNGMVGIKGGAGTWLLNPQGHYAGNDSAYYGMTYGLQCVSVTVNDWTGFEEITFGKDAFSLQLGLHRCLGRKARPRQNRYELP